MTLVRGLAWHRTAERSRAGSVSGLSSSSLLSFVQSDRTKVVAVYFEELLERSPYELKAWTNLGNIALVRRDFVKARYYYEGALKIQPTDAQAVYSLGLCDYYEGKVAEARARWQQALKLDPSLTKARQALEQKK